MRRRPLMRESYWHDTKAWRNLQDGARRVYWGRNRGLSPDLFIQERVKVKASLLSPRSQRVLGRKWEYVIMSAERGTGL
jgi:hypothetical protein